MDTIQIPHPKTEKAATIAVSVGIIICLLVSQNLLTLAKDLGVGNYTGISPTLNYLIER